MSTTTIRLPDELKTRVERLSAARGSTSHAFMLDAIVEVADRLERRQAFDAEAERRWKKMLRTGEYLSLDDLRSQVSALARGEQPQKPATRKMSTEELERLRASARRAG